jgi:hypothetical protein
MCSDCRALCGRWSYIPPDDGWDFCRRCGLSVNCWWDIDFHATARCRECRDYLAGESTFDPLAEIT